MEIVRILLLSLVFSIYGCTESPKEKPDDSAPEREKILDEIDTLMASESKDVSQFNLFLDSDDVWIRTYIAFNMLESGDFLGRKSQKVVLDALQSCNDQDYLLCRSLLARLSILENKGLFARDSVFSIKSTASIDDYATSLLIDEYLRGWTP